MKNQDPTKICFILGMMPRTGTNWVYDILLQSDSIGDIGPIWEDNLLNQIEALERAAKMISGTWNPKWRAADEELSVQQLTDHLQKNLESGLEKFIVQQFRPGSCTKKKTRLAGSKIAKCFQNSSTTAAIASKQMHHPYSQST